MLGDRIRDVQPALSTANAMRHRQITSLSRFIDSVKQIPYAVAQELVRLAMAVKPQACGQNRVWL